jgi:hypothetical protein
MKQSMKDKTLEILGCIAVGTVTACLIVIPVLVMLAD